MSDITQSQLNTLEKALDKLFASLGIDIEFTRHFLDRVNDTRNKQPIALMELADVFGKTYQKYGKRIHDMNEAAEAVLTDLKTMINIPFVVRHNRRTGMLEMISKTVMRKKGFLSHDPKLVLNTVGRVVTAATNFVYHDFEVIPLKKVGHISKGGINEWKKNSGDIELAGKAAAFYAKRYREDVFVIPGNSYGHRLWNPVMSSQGMNGTRGIRMLTVVTPKEGQLIILVKPNGDVWHGHYHFGTSE